MKTIITYVIIFIVLIIIALIAIKLKKKDFNIESNKLLGYLGGKDNIITAECNLSRFKVTLKDTSVVNKDGIQKLGAKGIVEVDNQLKIIYGRESRQLKRYIDDLV
ncbi:MAG: PTS transporter subunit EIIB [Bacilli bacterium]|nr:PTS transporter subunit EIIB [Bacilli bacterium]